MNDETGIEWIEVKLTATRRKVAHAMRRSRAQLLRKLTPQQRDAEFEIERAFKLVAGHMGYGTIDPLRTRGQAHESDKHMEWVVRQVQKLNQWQDQCPAAYKGIVIDYTVFCLTFADIAWQRGLNIKTVSDRYRRGLNEYARIQGW